MQTKLENQFIHKNFEICKESASFYKEQNMDSLLVGNSQGTSQPKMKEEAGRLQRKIRKLKKLLTKEITACIDKIGHFKTKYPDNFSETTVQIDYAESILCSVDRCRLGFTNLEKALEDLKMLLWDMWEGEDDKLETAQDKLTQDLVIYETKYLQIARENDETIERCNSLLLAFKPKVSNKTQENETGKIYFHDTTIGNAILKD